MFYNKTPAFSEKLLKSYRQTAMRIGKFAHTQASNIASRWS